MPKVDIRIEAAKFYDYNPNSPDDIPFYREHIPAFEASLLELGCGTGRVTLPLSAHCQYVHGIDRSPAMIAICQEKLEMGKLSLNKVRVEVGDITCFDLGRRFDLIIAPFRVMQNLETDADLDGLFSCIRQHLSPEGTAILNVFKPNAPPAVLAEKWSSVAENLNWEVPTPEGKITCSDRRAAMDAEKMILYPELIYRRYAGDQLVDEAVLKIVMRCYYPEQFIRLIEDHGFRIVNCWGGYAGEIYGEGPELVVQFRAS